ncbi:MAG: mechanosensitive ion channel domain-containing protein [bacterium]
MKKRIVILVLLLGFTTSIFGQFNFPQIPQQTLFPSSITQRKAQIESLEKELKEFSAKTTQKIEDIKKAEENIFKELNLATENKESASKNNDEAKLTYWNQKITFLTEQKQNLISIQNILKNTEDLKRKQLDKINEIIDFLSGKNAKQLKNAYSWSELKTAQNNVADLAEKIKVLKNKLDNVQRNKKTETETISSLKKQIDIKNTEQEKALNDLREQAKKETAIDQNITEKIGFTQALFTDEITSLSKKLERANTKTEELEQDIKLKTDELILSENIHLQEKDALRIIESKVIITKKDVDDARLQAHNENQKALAKKNELNKTIPEIQFNKTKLDEKIDELTKLFKKLEEKKDTSTEYYKISAQLAQAQNQALTFERQINKFETQISLLDAQVKEKNLWLDQIELHRTLLTKKEDLGELFSKFTSQKDEEVSLLKKLQDKKLQATDISIEIDKKIAQMEKNKELVAPKKGTVFAQDEKAFYSVLNNFESAKKQLELQRKFFNQENLDTSKLIEKQEKIIKQYNLILTAIETQRVEQDIWERSPKAISFNGFKTSLLEAETFFKKLFWDTPIYLGPTSLITSLRQASLDDLFSLFFCILFYLLVLFFSKKFLLFLKRKFKIHMTKDHKLIGFLPLSILTSLIEFIFEYIIIFTLWFFVFTHIVFDFKYIFFSLKFFAKPYFVAMFYLITIPVMLHLAHNLLLQLKELNKQLSFLFFTEKLQDRFILLISSFCFSTAILIPLKSAFLAYFPTDPTIFPDVIRAAYSLILVIILLLFFSKEDILRLIPSRFTILTWLKEKIDKHYYPVFFFLMGLLILSNPYIGYSNLSWFLAFAIPTTSLFIYAIFIIHSSIRKYAFFLFIKEEEEELIDKFEYAKTYYGIFVIFSFITLSIITFLLASRIWGYEYTFFDLWKALADKWVIPLGAEYKLGFVQLMTLVLFIVIGFFISSLTHKFILSKLFEILQTEPGTQNTFSKMVHYTIITISTVLGIISIHLEGAFWYVGTALGVAFGLAIKDIVADYLAGFFVLIERPIEIGNFISIDTEKEGEIQGTVHKINARTTTLINRLKHSIIIPNKDLAAKTINNWGKGRFAVGFEILINVDYDSDIDLVKQTILDVIQANPTILRVPKTIVRLENFEDNSLFFMSRAFISSRRINDQWDIAADLRAELFKTFKEKGIVFAFPQRVIHIKGEPKMKPQSPMSFNFDKK